LEATKKKSDKFSVKAVFRDLVRNGERMKKFKEVFGFFKKP